MSEHLLFRPRKNRQQFLSFSPPDEGKQHHHWSYLLYTVSGEINSRRLQHWPPTILSVISRNFELRNQTLIQEIRTKANNIAFPQLYAVRPFFI